MARYGAPTRYPPAIMRARLRPLRYWGPFLIACACLAAGYSVPPWAAYVLVIVAIVLFFEVATALFERAGGTGGLKDFKQ
jgi:integral membrane sensor domain MASE1